MNQRSRTRAYVVVAVCLCFGFVLLAYTQTASAVQSTVQKEAGVTAHASGTFEVKLTPQRQDEKTEDARLARMTIEKQWHGGLEGMSEGQMLTAGTSVKGSAGYVAIERFGETLEGRSGSFVLQQSGTMTRGAP